MNGTLSQDGIVGSSGANLRSRCLADTPVMISDDTLGKIAGRWTAEYFKLNSGGCPVVVHRRRGVSLSEGQCSSAQVEASCTISLSEAMKLLSSTGGSEWALQELRMADELPELLADLRRFCQGIPVKHVVSGYLLLNGSGCRAVPQRSNFSNRLLAQIFGYTRVTLRRAGGNAAAPPDALPDYYADHSRDSGAKIMWTALLASEGESMSCDLIPGSALYVPANWWLSVELMDMSATASLSWSVNPG
jgi:hypothetical protein